MPPEPDLPPTVPGRVWLASDPEAPTELLERLAADPDPLVRMEVARNPATPLAVLETLAADPDPLVRVHAVDDGAAFSEDRRAELWDRLATDPNWRARGFAAVAPGLPSAILERLAEDPDQDVRRAVAERDLPDVTPDLMERLSRDPAPEVRARIALHPAFPPALAAALPADPNGRDGGPASNEPIAF